MKKYFAIAIVVVGLFSFWFYSKHPLQTTVKIRDSTFAVDVAITPKEKELGLGNRDSLATNHGMLFVYDHKEIYSYWMRNMNFPIDIIWIDDRTIVDITKDIPPPANSTNQLPLYRPSVPVDKVLEVNAGLTDTYNISVGDRVVIKN